MRMVAVFACGMCCVMHMCALPRASEVTWVCLRCVDQPLAHRRLCLSPSCCPVLQEVSALLDRGVFDNDVLLAEGWVSGLKYEDEITDDLKKRTGGKVGGGWTLVVVRSGGRMLA
jgi:hypothetical protein